MISVSEPVEHGDTVELPSNPTIDVAVQSSGMAVNIFIHAVGEEPTATYTVELADTDGTDDIDLSADTDHVAVTHVDYKRMVAVTFTKDNEN